MVNLGLAYVKGRSVKKDIQKGIQYWEKASDLLGKALRKNLCEIWQAWSRSNKSGKAQLNATFKKQYGAKLNFKPSSYIDHIFSPKMKEA